MIQQVLAYIAVAAPRKNDAGIFSKAISQERENIRMRHRVPEAALAKKALDRKALLQLIP